MNGYRLPLSCPNCGADLAHVVASRVYVEDGRQSASAVAKCVGDGCRREWQVCVSLVAVPSFAAERQQRHRERKAAARVLV